MVRKVGELPLSEYPPGRREVSRIPVQNRQGEVLMVCEFEIIEAVSDRFSRKLVQFALEDGRLGSFIDADTFQLLESAEQMRRIEGDDPAWPRDMLRPAHQQIKARGSYAEKNAKQRAWYHGPGRAMREARRSGLPKGDGER